MYRCNDPMIQLLTAPFPDTDPEDERGQESPPIVLPWELPSQGGPLPPHQQAIFTPDQLSTGRNTHHG